MTLTPVLLSGGVGTRLWPLSRNGAPKQLQSMIGAATMVQSTIARLGSVDDVGSPMVVCNQRHVDAVVGQLADIGVVPRLVVAEEVGRNTGPAVLAAALLSPEDDVLLVLPADHVIADLPAFTSAVKEAVTAASDGRLVTFGVVPDRPETGYGYIRSGVGRPPALPVEEFVEKPDLPTAVEYVRSGRYLWNSGMFAFRAREVIAEFERHAPEMTSAVRASLAAVSGGPMVVPGAPFALAPALSIDHAVMEHTDRAVVVPLDAGWSDVGSWATLWDIEDKDDDGNVLVGDVLAMDVTDSYLRSDGRLVAVLGLDEVVVVDTPDALLVAHRRRVQDVKKLVDRLTGRPELD